MCLYTSQRRLKTAKEDIKCYKVLQSVEALDHECPCIAGTAKAQKYQYLTPYQYFPMKPGETYTDESRAYIGKHDENDIADVGAKYFHTFTNIRAALDGIVDCCMSGAIIVECIIPKGTKYLEGAMFYIPATHGEISAYASKTIKLTDKIIAQTELSNLTLKLSYGGKTYKDSGYLDDNHFYGYWVEVDK